MKFIINRENPRQRIVVPNPAKKLSGLDNETELELHALNGAIVIAKAGMTAMDLVSMFWSLTGTTVNLLTTLARACGTCDGCGYCDHLCDTQTVSLPEVILEAAGLPLGSKLAAEVDNDGNIMVCLADHDYDLSDVPPDMLTLVRSTGICIRALEEHLMNGGIIYGGNDGDADDF